MTVLYIRQSEFTGQSNGMDLPTTPEKLRQWETWNRAPGTPLVQEFFSELNEDEREFVLTGCTPEEWDSLVGNEEEE